MPFRNAGAAGWRRVFRNRRRSCKRETLLLLYCGSEWAWEWGGTRPARCGKKQHPAYCRYFQGICSVLSVRDSGEPAADLSGTGRRSSVWADACRRKIGPLELCVSRGKSCRGLWKNGAVSPGKRRIRQPPVWSCFVCPERQSVYQHRFHIFIRLHHIDFADCACKCV